jgi:predicted deacylase
MTTNMPQPRLGKLLRPPIRLSRAAQRVTLPVWIAAGYRPGATGLLGASIEGEEIQRILLLQRFVQGPNLREMAGRQVIVPVANLRGFRVGSRCVPEDARDLNRCFPGDPEGSLSERIPHLIFTEWVSGAEWGVELHDPGVGGVRLPHARVHEKDVLDFGAGCRTGQS